MTERQLVTPPREHGSEPHWGLGRVAVRPSEKAPVTPWSGTPHLLLASGRDAMVAALQGAKFQGARRLFCPSYFCQEVVPALASAGLPLLTYPDAPTLPPPRWGQLNGVATTDVVLTCGFFGVRGPGFLDAPPAQMIIEDHSHDPYSSWAFCSKAHYAVASLRKSLPLPDGAVLWSPRGSELPEQPPFLRQGAVADKLSGMLLKAAYLEGVGGQGRIAKNTFRDLLASGEEQMGAGPLSGISPLSAAALALVDGGLASELRRRNHAAFVSCLSELKDPLPMAAVEEAAPFAVSLIFSTRQRRDQARTRLIERGVYPSVLWSLDEPQLPAISAEHIELAGRMLAIACDARYAPGDMEWAAARLLEAL
ncbi:MAG: hypothetical protein ABJA82_00135 [Myxococcales bacterium]